jgi:molecular chaperone GrpE
MTGQRPAAPSAGATGQPAAGGEQVPARDEDLAGQPDAGSPVEAVDFDEAAEPDVPDPAADVEADLDLARLAQERDEYLDALRRLQADFENYKKRMLKQQTSHLERAAEVLVEKLLPVFDVADLAVAHGGGEEVKQIWTALFDAMEREGLERIDPLNEPFDPTVHDAVAHEPGEGEPEVVEVMRAGYRWKGRVLRPAMVKVRG